MYHMIWLCIKPKSVTQSQYVLYQIVISHITYSKVMSHIIWLCNKLKSVT